MQIHIDTATDDLPAVIRMLQALHGESPTGRLHKLMDAVGCQPVIKSGPDHKIEGKELDYRIAPPEVLAAAQARKAAAQAVDSEGENLGTAPDHAADANSYGLHCTGHVDYAPETRVEAPTPEQVFAAPKSLFDAPLTTTVQGEVSSASTRLNDVTVDAAGLPWDARIHSGAKTKLANGNWKLLRNVDPALVASVEAELRGAPKPAAPTTPAAAQVVEPASVPLPPVPVAPPAGVPSPPAPLPTPPAPKPITNAAQLVAAVMDKRFTTDQVNAACQAVGVENVASLLAKQDKLPDVLRQLGVSA